MNTADFLFPAELRAKQTDLRNVLIIGSCLSERYVDVFKRANSRTAFDHILFNHSSKLPAKTADELQSYDLQYIQLPLRSVLTDGVIRVGDSINEYHSVDWLEIGKRNLLSMLAEAMRYNLETGIITFVSNFIVPQGNIASSLKEYGTRNDLTRIVGELNFLLADQLVTYENAFVANVDAIANTIGKRYFMNDIIYFHSHGAMFDPNWSNHENLPYWTAPDSGRIEQVPALGETYENKNGEFFDAIFRQIESLYRTTRQMDIVKIVIFDLDNTMWRGQLVEHYQAGANWPYADGWPQGLWESIQILRRRGIIVSLASKNDEEVVRANWGNAVQPPFVKFEDFVAPQINWKPKAENIKEILKTLSLTPSSAVFVDDNPVERESVRALLPGIRVIGADPFVIRRILLWSAETQIPRKTDESGRREEMLKAQIVRESERETLSRSDFLNGLNSKVILSELHDISQPEFTRVLELVNKTNQFNTTGVRWSVSDFKSHLGDGGRVFFFSVRDRFTEYGLTGVLFFRRDEILQFVMSCRVLGLEIEAAVLFSVTNLVRRSDISGGISATIIPTTLNSACREVFSSAGFSKMADERFYLEAGRDCFAPPHVEVVLAPA